MFDHESGHKAKKGVRIKMNGLLRSVIALMLLTAKVAVGGSSLPILSGSAPTSEWPGQGYQSHATTNDTAKHSALGGDSTLDTTDSEVIKTEVQGGSQRPYAGEGELGFGSPSGGLPNNDSNWANPTPTRFIPDVETSVFDHIIRWLKDNKEWTFSGWGLAAVVFVWSRLSKRNQR